ncbi:protein TRACHEARY ELEMENT DIFFERENTIATION-RELATED 7A-like isoform X2 [Coregonus clupeaformis]|uniref:protein TRACHEARY ELEMENT DIFFERENTIATION-RELATED 7A-like isoform X2 n=1 Tax=Coregonus clupeaformis TaxID=59861 RepID=UPI001E1C820E|nr:protein TRACHEARY ELEMENT DIFFERENTIATION-RELATED 7A-like isoform X2 [Coregonus clupeaformis]
MTLLSSSLLSASLNSPSLIQLPGNSRTLPCSSHTARPPPHQPETSLQQPHCTATTPPAGDFPAATTLHGHHPTSRTLPCSSHTARPPPHQPETSCSSHTAWPPPHPTRSPSHRTLKLAHLTSSGCTEGPHTKNALLKLVKWNQINCSMDLVPFNQL